VISTRIALSASGHPVQRREFGLREGIMQVKELHRHKTKTCGTVVELEAGKLLVQRIGAYDIKTLRMLSYL